MVTGVLSVALPENDGLASPSDGTDRMVIVGDNVSTVNVIGALEPGPFSMLLG
jgi:hypothetical protein